MKFRRIVFSCKTERSITSHFFLRNSSRPFLSFDFSAFSCLFLEGPHNDKEASTFVLMFCTLFILHNIQIRCFRLINNKTNMYGFGFLAGLANHRKDDAEGDNASPMAFTQSFQASTTAYTSQRRRRRGSPGRACHLMPPPRTSGAEARRGRAVASFPAQRRPRSGRGRRPGTVPLWMSVSAVTVRPRTRGVSLGMPVSV